ncbi:MAG: hypothetical protein ABI574_05775 [Burkholderiales bacterium]
MTDPAHSDALLPQQIAPADDLQCRLTEDCLSARTEVLMAYFLALRREVDKVLSARLPAAAGKPYPYGRCEEITREVYARLGQRLRTPHEPVERLLADFVSRGGIARTVWGVLREQYFQNALQFGALYIDVSNDTVVVSKPPVEILPMASSGLVNVQDLAHFRQTAERYWGATLYANHLVPTLAPLLPMVSVSPGRLQPGLQSACDYMIGLMCRDGFAQAEQWLQAGPPPPPELTQRLLAATPADLQPWTSQGGVEAVMACRRARAAGGHLSADWRQARLLDYLRSLQGPAGQAS